MRGSKSSHLDHLANVSLFAAFSKRDLQKIARVSDEVEVPEGKVLVDQGRMGHEFFLIIEGTAVVRANGRKMAELGPGQYFGELALLTRAPRNATVEAKTPMRLLVLGQREFAGVIDEVPGLAHKLLGRMAERLREADVRAVSH